METFVEDESWLKFLAAQLTQHNFPQPVIDRLHAVSAVVANNRASIESVDADLVRARNEVDKLEKTLRIAVFDLEDMYLRYKIVCSELAKYDEERAAAYSNYRPGLHAAIKKDSRTAE